LNVFGFRPSDFARTVEVWPENWPAVETFIRLRTQWNVGNKGATGLRYEAVFQYLDRMQLTGNDWWEMFDDICLMEHEALVAMHDNN
jgi:hypothetical protein